MKITYLTPTIWTQVIYTVGLYNISVLESGKTTSTTYLGMGIPSSYITVENVKYLITLEGDKIFMDYKEGIIEIY
jgi:hypothetical protein